MAITDSLCWRPDTTGTFDYNANPNIFGTLSLGSSFATLDPVFNELVFRLSNVGANADQNFNYAFHYINADATMFFYNTGSGLEIRNFLTGAVIYSGQPTGNDRLEVRWSMTDPDKYYFISGTSYVRRSLAAQTTTTIRNFTVESGGTNLQVQGGSVNQSSADDNIVVLKWSNTHHVYNIALNLVYTGNIPEASSTGYMGITPNGARCYSGGNSGAQPGHGSSVFMVYDINHSAHTVDTVGRNVWDLGGDHGVACSASDGKDYIATFDATGSQEDIFAVDMSVDRSGQSVASQRASSVLLLTLLTATDEGHFSAVSVGANTDWVFFSAESHRDNFSQAVAACGTTTGLWHPYQGEILAMNVVTGAHRRLCHHRSRGRSNQLDYQAQPKVSCSPKGDAYLFSSNQNVSTPANFADIFGGLNPLGSNYNFPWVRA